MKHATLAISGDGEQMGACRSTGSPYPLPCWKNCPLYRPVPVPHFLNQFVPEQDSPEAGLEKSKRLQEAGLTPSSSLRLAARDELSGAECPVPQAAADVCRRRLP